MSKTNVTTTPVTVEVTPQQIQDEQGYIIVSCGKPKLIGQVADIRATRCDEPIGQAVVISTATRQEFYAQVRRFFPDNIEARITKNGSPYYYKMKGE